MNSLLLVSSPSTEFAAKFNSDCGTFWKSWNIPASQHRTPSPCLFVGVPKFFCMKIHGCTVNILKAQGDCVAVKFPIKNIGLP